MSASCESARKFGSRKYTSGNYITSKHKAGKTKISDPVKEKPLYASSKKGLITEEFAQEIITGLKEPELSDPIVKEKINRNIQKNVSAFLFNNIRKKKIAFQKNHLPKKTPGYRNKYDVEPGSSLDPKALLSVILAVLGIAFEIFGYILVAAITFEYTFLFMMVLGYILGVTAVIVSIKTGVRNHRKENSSNTTFVLSFIGTVFGAIAMCLIILLFIILLVGF